MKKWICAMLCLSMVAGMVSVEANASVKIDTNETVTQEIQIMNVGVKAASPESASVETSSQETPALPPFAGNITVNAESVFTAAVNAAEKKCVITGYTGTAMATTIYIPEKINGNTVVSVLDKVFVGCPYLKNVVVMGDVEFQGGEIFYQTVKPEIWGKSGGMTAAYAAGAGLIFHPMEGPQSVTIKKAASLTKATVSWSAVNGAVSYKLYRKKGKESFAFCGEGAGAVTTFVNSGLKVGAKYVYKVVPVFQTSNGETIEGYSSKETSVSMIPAKLKGVKAKGIRGGIQLRWKRNKNVSGYQVFMKVHVKGFKTNFNRVKTIKKNKINGYRCKMLVRGMKYSYKVRAYKVVKGKKIYGSYVTVSAKAK